MKQMSVGRFVAIQKLSQAEAPSGVAASAADSEYLSIAVAVVSKRQRPANSVQFMD